MENNIEIFEIAGRTAGGFFVLLLMTRILGKKQLSHLTFFNYVTGIAIGSIAASVAIDKRINFIEAITSLALWSLLTILIGYISLKSSNARVILDGQPTIVIKKGEILEEALAQCNLNMDDLSMLLRGEHVFSLKDVEYAILEPHGQLSVMKTKAAQTVTNGDLKIKHPPMTYFPSELIVDGTIVDKNLRELNLTKKWLLKELDKQNIQSLSEVFYAELQEDGSLLIDKKGNSREYHN